MKAATINWQFWRAPDEVPTPVAIALADFCRRAGVPSSAAEVRTALALLRPVDDARVCQLAAAEPLARPLGPFAVVDAIKGTPIDEAARRQTWGVYFGVVAELPPPPTRAIATSASPRITSPAPTSAAAEKKARRGKAAPPPTMAEKIAPRRRAPGDASAPEAPATSPSGNAALPKRQLPTPRGRFVRIDDHSTTREPPRS